MAAGLVPAIHAFIQRRKQEADARDKPGMTEETGALGCGLISTQPKTIIRTMKPYLRFRS